MPEALESLAAVPGIDGCAIVSTCNRTEIYVSSEQPITHRLTDWLHHWHDLAPGQFREHFYLLEQSACIFHLIKVIAGADSMIIGEPQVAGQVKQSWQSANALGVLDSKLDRMFQHSFAGAKRVRSETGIARNPVTLPFAILRLARQIFGSPTDMRALLIGAGEMIEDCARHFHETGIESLSVVNRNPERAINLAETFGGTGHSLEELPGLLAGHDLVIACTASPEPILTRTMFREALAARRHSPQFAVDLSVPRNIEPGCADLDDLFLYTIDDLHTIVESNQRARREALEQAMSIIESEVTAFERWLRLQDTSETLKDLRRRARRERDTLLEQARTQLAAGHDPEAVMQRMSHRLVNRLLHGPSVRIRQAAETADETLLEAARFYFLDDSS